MYILSPENTSIDIDEIPDTVEEDILYCTMMVKSDEVDFFFNNLLSTYESFIASAYVLRIGEYEITLPWIEQPNDYKILIGDPETGDLEILSVEELNGKGFSAFVYNPLSSFRPEYKTIDVIDVYHDMKWFFPRTNNNNMLCVPLKKGYKPPCIYIAASSVVSKIDMIDIQQVVNWSTIFFVLINNLSNN